MAAFLNFHTTDIATQLDRSGMRHALSSAGVLAFGHESNDHIRPGRGLPRAWAERTGPHLEAGMGRRLADCVATQLAPRRPGRDAPGALLVGNFDRVFERGSFGIVFDQPRVGCIRVGEHLEMILVASLLAGIYVNPDELRSKTPSSLE